MIPHQRYSDARGFVRKRISCVRAQIRYRARSGNKHNLGRSPNEKMKCLTPPSGLPNPRRSVQKKGQSCTGRANQSVSYRKTANPVRSEQTKAFRTEKRPILYGTGKPSFVQKKGQSCTERANSGVSYRKTSNPVRGGQTKAFRTEKRPILYGTSEGRAFQTEKGSQAVLAERML